MSGQPYNRKYKTQKVPGFLLSSRKMSTSLNSILELAAVQREWRSRRIKEENSSLEVKVATSMNVLCLSNLEKQLELLVLVDSIISTWRACLLTMLRLTLMMNKPTLIKIMQTSSRPRHQLPRMSKVIGCYLSQTKKSAQLRLLQGRAVSQISYINARSTSARTR